jgi:uridine phosphorylase
VPETFPILEFDPTREAFVEPSRVNKALDVPKHCVLCFFQDVIRTVVHDHHGHIVATQRSEAGEFPLYEIAHQGQRLGIFHPGVGAPLAAGLLEELIARGCEKFVVCGGAGALDRAITVGHLVIPASAVRDEGTSYHYLPPSREVAASPAGVAAIERVLQEHHLPYVAAKTWTTDAFYRETPARIQARRAEGCVVVEMEAAAFFAVAQFRGVVLAQILYGGDDLSGEVWDPREWDQRTTIRERLFWLAAEACLSL